MRNRTLKEYGIDFDEIIPSTDNIPDAFANDLTPKCLMVNLHTLEPCEQHYIYPPQDVKENEPKISHYDSNVVARENNAMENLGIEEHVAEYTTVMGYPNCNQNPGNFKAVYYMDTNINTGHDSVNINVVLSPTRYDNMCNQAVANYQQDSFNAEQNASSIENRKDCRLSSRASSTETDQGYASKESSPTHQPPELTENGDPDLHAVHLPSQRIYSPILMSSNTMSPALLESIPGPSYVIPKAVRPFCSRTKINVGVKKLNKVNLIFVCINGRYNAV